MKDLVKVDFLKLGDFVEVGSNYLRLAEDIPNEALGAVYARLKILGGAMQWMVGDLLSQIENLRGSELARKMMEDWEVEYGRASTFKRVATAIDRSLRRPELSFSHHEEALNLCDTVDDALDLLDAASANGWSVAKMRQSFAAKLVSPPRPQPTMSFQPVYDCLRFVRSTDPTKLDSDTRQALKKELGPIVELWQKL